MIKGIWVAVLAAFFIAGCTTTDPYRTSFGEFCEFERAPDCAEQVMNVSALDSVEEYRLSFIEYDDQGQLNVPEAQKIVTDAYREIAEESGILLMVLSMVGITTPTESQKMRTLPHSERSSAKHLKMKNGFGQ